MTSSRSRLCVDPGASSRSDARARMRAPIILSSRPIGLRGRLTKRDSSDFGIRGQRSLLQLQQINVILMTLLNALSLSDTRPVPSSLAKWAGPLL